MVGISALLGFVKLTNFADVMNIQNSLIGFITSIDLYIVSIFVILIKKEVQHNEMEFLVSTEKQGICKTDRLCKETVTTQSAVEKDKLDLSGLNRRQKLIFYILATGYQFLQLGAVLAIGFIGNAIFELIAMLATFWLGRRILKKCWHSEKLSICSFVTIASFYVLTRITLPFSISLFCCIILSSAFTYGLYLLAIHFETIENLKGTCLTKGQAEIDLRNKCFDKGLDETETKMCVDYFIHRLSHKEIAVKYGIELQTSLNKKLRFKKKLEGK